MLIVARRSFHSNILSLTLVLPLKDQYRCKLAKRVLPIFNPPKTILQRASPSRKGPFFTSLRSQELRRSPEAPLRHFPVILERNSFFFSVCVPYIFGLFCLICFCSLQADVILYISCSSWRSQAVEHRSGAVQWEREVAATRNRLRRLCRKQHFSRNMSYEGREPMRIDIIVGWW